MFELFCACDLFIYKRAQPEILEAWIRLCGAYLAGFEQTYPFASNELGIGFISQNNCDCMENKNDDVYTQCNWNIGC